MMKMINAFTEEIDDVELAVSEILEQLDLENNLMKYAAGIMTCYMEFIDTGVVAALCERLPFDVVGCTTLGNSTNGQSGGMLLCISMLTSDDVSFAAVQSAELDDGNLAESLANTYKAAIAGHGGERPAMAIPFLPMLRTIGGSIMIEHLNAVSGGVPLYGTICCDHTAAYNDSYTIYNGVASKKAAAILALFGDVQPKFFIASISEEKIQKQKAIITQSEGNVLMKVNDMPILRYMETLGLTKGDGIEGASAIPFVVDYNDGTAPSACAIYLVLENGYLSCGAPVPEGSTLAIGAIDHGDVITTAEQILTNALQVKDKHAMLMFPCLSRSLALDADEMAEMNQIQQMVGDCLPYHMGYSGGEVCPVYAEDGTVVNRFHNFTFTVCVL